MEIVCSTDDIHDIERLRASTPPDGVDVEFPYEGIEAKTTPTETAFFILSIPLDIATSVLGNWLYDKVKHSASKEITIETEKIHITAGDITVAIDKVIRTKKIQHK